MLFSIERTIAVCFPLRRYEICTCTRNKSSFIIIISLGLLLYLFSLKTTGLEEHDSRSSCVLHKKWLKFVSYMSFGDMIIAIFIPFVFILFANLLISIKLIRFSSSFAMLKKIFCKCSTKQSSTSENCNSDELSFSLNKCGKSEPMCLAKSNLRRLTKGDMPKSFISNAPKRSKSYSRTLRVLFTISTTFILLNFPIAMNKMWYFFKYHNTSFSDVILQYDSYENQTSEQQMEKYEKMPDTNYMLDLFENNDPGFNYSVHDEAVYANKSSHYTEIPYEELEPDKSNANPLEEIIERISCYLYYLNFSLNFFLYSTTGSKFRNNLLGMLRRQRSSQVRRMSRHAKCENGVNTVQMTDV